MRVQNLAPRLAAAVTLVVLCAVVAEFVPSVSFLFWAGPIIAGLLLGSEAALGSVLAVVIVPGLLGARLSGGRDFFALVMMSLVAGGITWFSGTYSRRFWRFLRP